jgi:hypothetical protein
MPSFETTRGPAWEAAGRVLIPVARVLRLRAPGNLGGLVWSRPHGIEVLEAGQRRFIKVVDRTRYVQWLMLGAGLFVGLLLRRRR